MREEDFFSVFGLKRSFSLDAGDLERRFYALSRELHPDRFATRPAGERAQAMDRMSLLNRAYGTLKSASDRRAYLLRLEGVLSPESGGKGAKQIPLELAESWFELQEALGEAPEDEIRSKITDFTSKLNEAEERARAEIATLEKQYEESGTRGLLEKLAGIVQRQSYLATLRRDLERLQSKPKV